MGDGGGEVLMTLLVLHSAGGGGSQKASNGPRKFITSTARMCNIPSKFQMQRGIVGGGGLSRDLETQHQYDKRQLEQFLTSIMRSKPDKNRSECRRNADKSCSLGIWRSAAHCASALISRKCVVCGPSVRGGQYYKKGTNEITHGLKFNTPSHSSRRSRFLHSTFVCL